VSREFRYRAFGLHIGSDLELPELLETDAPPEVSISAGLVPETLEGASARGVRYQVRGDDYLLSVDGIARFLVSGGRRIVYERAAPADDDAVRVFLVGRPLGALLHQRGVVPLHAGAIRVGESCVAFVGPSGTGKSTLVAAFRKRGYKLLGDEVCALGQGPGGVPHVTPGLPSIKLWRDALGRLGEDPGALRRVRPRMQKFWLGCREQFEESALPLERLYVLRTTNRSTGQITQLQGTDKLQAFLGDTYARPLVGPLGALPRHFQICAAAAQHARVSRVVRPSAGFSAERVADLIEQDFGQ
jgi:hypothetical protein